MDDFVLRRDRLTLFVIGPGFGESVLVALPESDAWLVIDGAGPNDVLPAKLHLAKHWTDKSTIELLLLTHPHADHYPGIDKMLDDPTLAGKARRVGCVCEYLGAEGTLSAELRAAFQLVDVDDAETQTALGRARAVLERISHEWMSRPDCRFRAVAGEEISIGPTKVTVLSPTREEATAFFGAPQLAERIRDHANDLSVVLELRYGETVLLLGADLPSTRGATDVVSGWSSVAARRDDLDRHVAYKVAHHASAEAIHSQVVRGDRSKKPRSWVATPYNKGAKLPDFTDAGGLAVLHGHEASGVALTGLPVGAAQQQPMPDSVRRTEVRADDYTLPGLGMVRASGRSKATATECVWVFEFDDKGSELARRRGEAATLVLPG